MSGNYEVVVYIVQAQNGDVLAAKLTRGAAQSFARYHAPAKISKMTADKMDLYIGRTTEPV